MTTVLFWAVVIAASIIVLCKTHIAAEHNVAGEQKVNGKWVQTMYPDHYTFFGIYLCYWWGALIAIFLSYLAIAFLLDFTGYAERFEIQTGFQTLVNSLNNK
jgi:hypothetical protein